MKILIVSPSLDENENVSGISTLVRGIIDNGDAEYHHFIAGRRDDESFGLFWLIKQFLLPLSFLVKLLKLRPDVVHINTAFVPLAIWRDAVLTFISAFFGFPVLLHPNGGRYLMEDFDSALLAGVASEMVHLASAVLVLSDLERDNLKKRWPKPTIYVLPNAIEINELPARAANVPPVFLFFGRLHESKGLDEIIDACRELKEQDHNFRFNCYGAGPQEDHFVAEMTTVLGEAFYFGGVVAGGEKQKVLSAADVFVLPSRYGEGMPLAILEAIAARLTVVAADVASVRAVIKDGETGILIEPYNSPQLAEKLRDLLDGKIDQQVLRENALEKLRQEYSIDEYSRSLEAIYRKIAR